MDEHEILALHHEVLAAWNAYDAPRFAGHFARDGSIVGFDGSQVDGRAAIEAHLTGIFADHAPPHYLAVVREIRRLGDGAALLRAVLGMAVPGADDIIPAVNAVQSMVAVAGGRHRAAAGEWRIALLQSTPAAFHGRPELADELSEELRAVLRSSRERS